MADWKERIEQATRDRDLNLQMPSVAEEPRRAIEDRISRDSREKELRINLLLRRIRAEELLRKTQAEIWEGYGNILRTANGIRLIFGFNTSVNIQVSSGWGGSDGAGWYRDERRRALGIAFTEVAVYDLGDQYQEVDVRDGEIRGAPDGNAQKKRWNAFFTGGNLPSDISSYQERIQKEAFLFNDSVPGMTEDVVLRFGINRIAEGRLPRQLKG